MSGGLEAGPLQELSGGLGERHVDALAREATVGVEVLLREADAVRVPSIGSRTKTNPRDNKKNTQKSTHK